MGALEETRKRLAVLDKLAQEVGEYADAILLVGSVAYGPKHAVREDSDLDLVLVGERFNPLAERILQDETLANALRRRYFDGVCLKTNIEDVPVSIHAFSPRTMSIIGNCFVADIRVLRPGGKAGTYALRGFEGQAYDYIIKNIALPDAPGYCRTIVPVGFIKDDRYYLGIHRDKILSNPQIIKDTGGVLARTITDTWRVACENLVDESYRLSGRVDYERFSLRHALAKFERMDEEVQEGILERMRETVSLVCREKGL